MSSAKVPQHLELEDVVVWGLSPSDLLFVIGGALFSWWVYLVIPGDLALRVSLAAPGVLVGLGLGLVRVGGRSARTWIAVLAAFALRDRVLRVGGRR